MTGNIPGESIYIALLVIVNIGMVVSILAYRKKNPNKRVDDEPDFL